ncbi:hypothetical protein [Nostoc sp. 'Peltigera membranacea cyanobiont' 232]|uniref:hypothetical protein n=1 Tax=Nostoc sp. 'Peltigera membranacea cyanobiont' 232 TaxID=2014531 RepID=UPI00117D1FB4|nr:hypothetical protein [Nostoc sp. 'Peltigera membranacea cyanobiont' 232]
MSKIIPISEIRDESCGGNTKKNGFGISPVTVGQEWFRSQASKIAPVVEVDSLNTGKYRTQLGLVKNKKDKSKQCPETHANDAIALAATFFIQYKEFKTVKTHGHRNLIQRGRQSVLNYELRISNYLDLWRIGLNLLCRYL